MELSVIVLTCNSANYISACLDSLLPQLDADIEVLVVDNGSGDESVDNIKGLCRSIKIIENKKNPGAAFARNQAISQCKGEWILTLDCDIILDSGFVNAFREFKLRISDTAGMIIPNMLSYDGSTVYSHGIYLSFLKRFYDYNYRKPYKFTRKKPKKVIGPCAAAAFYRRDMLESVKDKTGYFDERFFFLVEDVDLAWKCKKAGWNAVFCPQTVCFHAGNSCGAGKKTKQYLSYRNRRLMIEKNMNYSERLRLYLLSGLYECVRFAYLYMFNPYVRLKSKPEDIIGAGV